jgi:hypothetical protein
MNDTPAEMNTALNALRAEMTEIRKRLEKLESVVSFHERNGVECVSVECTDFVLRPWRDRRWMAVQMGTTEDGAFLQLNYSGEEHGCKAAINLTVSEDGEPHIQVRGKDCKVRGDFFIEADHGTLGAFGPGHKPGAVMRARPGGGAIAVLQPDGRARAVLIHDERHKSKGSDTETPATQLIFAKGNGKTLMNLLSDDSGSFIAVGHPGQVDAAVLMSREDGASLMMQSPALQTSVTLAATDELARVSAHQGRFLEDGAEVALSAGQHGSSMTLADTDTVRRVEITAATRAATVPSR